MRSITSTEPKFATPDSAPRTITAPSTALAQSALQVTRAALARWSGSSRPAGAPPRERRRVSPQARWLAEARFGLAAWIARGGFLQDESAVADQMAFSMYESEATDAHSDACID